MINYNNRDVVSRQMRHAIFEGTVCIYNEPITFELSDNLKINYAMRLAQNSDGVFYMIAAVLDNKNKSQIEVYRSTDNMGAEWVLESVKDLGKFSLSSFSMSCPRGNSTQDNVIDCLLFGNYYENWRNYSELYYFQVTLG